MNNEITWNTFEEKFSVSNALEELSFAENWRSTGLSLISIVTKRHGGISRRALLENDQAREWTEEYIKDSRWELEHKNLELAF